MQCEEVREQFADYVIDGLREPARSQVEQHLMVCDSCRAEAAELKTLWTGLESVTVAQPGPELRARFDVMLEAYKHGLEQASSASWWQRVNLWFAGWWPRQPVLQFGLALALLVIGISAGLLS